MRNDIVLRFVSGKVQQPGSRFIWRIQAQQTGTLKCPFPAQQTGPPDSFLLWQSVMELTPEEQKRKRVIQRFMAGKNAVDSYRQRQQMKKVVHQMAEPLSPWSDGMVQKIL